MLLEILKDDVPHQSKGKEKVIDVIMNELSSMTQLKLQIHMLKETFVTPIYDKEIVITFSTTELASTIGQKLNLVIFC